MSTMIYLTIPLTYRFLYFYALNSEPIHSIGYSNSILQQHYSLLSDAIKCKIPNEVPFPAGFRKDSKAKKEDLSLPSTKNEKEISIEDDGAEGEN